MLAAGFTDYLSKPVNVGEMEQTLLRYLPAAKVTLTDAEEGGDDLSLLPKGLRDIPLIDVAAGVSFCSDAQDYLKALQTYAGSIESKAAELEKCLNEMDLTGFTLKVHALKSTSRSIGALDLSEHAKALEQAGDAGDAETIRADTPALLAEYRSLAEPLESLFAAERDAAELPALSKPEFDEALATIHDLCVAYDDTSIQMAMDMLAGYAIQEPCRRRYRELKEAFERIDWEKMSELTTPDV
jgi:HPt (histidine-containing phosphotransfer) domain-containing protein